MTEQNKLPAYEIAQLEQAGKARLDGRTLPQHQPFYMFWTASALELNVKARELWLDVAVEWESSEVWVSVELDGKQLSRQILMPGNYSFCCFRGIGTEEPHQIRFIRETQCAAKTYLSVTHVRTDGELLPVPTPQYKIEIIGDSITSGEGLAVPATVSGWSVASHSATGAYHDFLAKQLHAQLHVLSCGGYGVYCGYNNNLHLAIPNYYRQVCGFMNDTHGQALGAMADYDFASWQPDLVLVMLGANDNGASHRKLPWTDENGVNHQLQLLPDGSFEPQSRQHIVDAAVRFLRQIREKNPATQILWANGVADAPISDLIIDAIQIYQCETGDTRVYQQQLSPRTDFCGHNHPGPQTHKRIAEELLPILRGLLEG